MTTKTYSDLLVLQIHTDTAAMEAAFVLSDANDTNDPDIVLYMRPHKPTGRPRWQTVNIHHAMWPLLSTAIDANIGTMLNGDPSTRHIVRGMWLLEVTESDARELESGWAVPNSLFTRVRKAMVDIPPSNSWTHGSLEEAGVLIHSALKDLHSRANMARWTESALEAISANIDIEDAADEYTMSDGRTFYPRHIMNVAGKPMNDVQFLRLQYKRKKAVLMLGPGGTGKTAAVEASCDRIFTTLFTAETTTLSLSGRWEPHPEIHGEFVWAKSQLVQSLEYATEHPEEQVVWYGDEAMQSQSTTLVMLHSVMDHRRVLLIEEGPGKGEIHAPDNWAVVLSSNPNEEGSSIGRPFASRCRPLDYRTNWEVVDKAVGPGFEQLITVARVMNSMLDNREVDWAPQTRHIVETAEDMTTLGVRYGLEQLLASCDLETGKCNSKELRRLEQVIAETYNEQGIKKLTIE